MGNREAFDEAILISLDGDQLKVKVDRGTVEALNADSLIRTTEDNNVPPNRMMIGFTYLRPILRCTVTERLYKSVDKNFTEEILSGTSSLAQSHPSEISISLDRLYSAYSQPNKLGFLIMRFRPTNPFQKLVKVIKETCKKHGLEIIRADEREFHADLWGNVRTLLHGCGFGIAVYERIETNEPNANVGLEIGYLMAMNKPVLLLKDKTVKTLQADLTGNYTDHLTLTIPRARFQHN